jgi:DNA uptake protein ComE-like DNA-binding protein
MMKKKELTPLEQLRKDLQKLRRTMGQAHSWQAATNNEMRERLGELETVVSEMAKCVLQEESTEPALTKSSHTRRTSRTNSKAVLGSSLQESSEPSPTTAGSGRLNGMDN